MNFIPKLVLTAAIGLSWNYTYNYTDLLDLKEWVKDATKEYSPDSWDLLMNYESIPPKQEAKAVNGRVITKKTVSAFYYLKGRNMIDLLSSMATNIHEIAHGYCDQNIFRYAREKGIKLDIDNAEEFLFYSPSRSFFISFPLKSLFPSRELVPNIPRNLRTFRYDTYINGRTSTQSEGVIGLLNELHAYYLESKFCYEMLKPYKKAEGSDVMGLFEWVYHSQSKMTAFFEFDFFIKEYLLHMKRKYPDDYRKLLGYRPFTEAYVTIHTSYKELTNKYLQRITREMTSLNASGKGEARIEGNRIWVKEAGSDASIGTPVFSADMETLLPVLNGSRYQEIIVDFLIPRIK
ncbi:MAG: hypothetical protein IQL11_09495 [Bacteroidales bacterium]|nr:hypothetical protein [Bacteroidales bacterium]